MYKYCEVPDPRINYELLAYDDQEVEEPLEDIGTDDEEVLRACENIVFPWQHVPVLTGRKRFMALCAAMGLKPSTMNR